MHRVGVISVLAFLLVSILSLAQQQTTATASIEGLVVRADSGEPVSGVQVMLSVGPGPAPIAAAVAAALRGGRGAASIPPTTTTGADGKYSFSNLSAGGYRLTATANGFVRQQYGQLALFGSGHIIFLTAGQAVIDAAIRLTATGTVKGKVFDEAGQPATGASIQLIHPVYTPQGRDLQEDGERGLARTDDRGEFRLYGVTPGRYYLVAGTPSGAQPVVSRYTLVYYPNSPELEQATLLDVKAGDEIAVDMHVQRQHQTYRVRGRIVDSRGTPPPSTQRILIRSRSLIGDAGVTGRTDLATGTFEVQDIPPGEYVVQVQESTSVPVGQTDAPRLAGRATVRLVDKDVDDVVVTLTSSIMTSGRISMEGQSISSLGALDNMRLRFSRPGPLSEFTVIVPVASPPKPDGSFEVALREGESRVQVNPVPPGYYVKSIDYGGTDILGKVYNFTASDVAKFKVTIRAGAAQINGTVADVNSQFVQGIPVVLIPVDHGRMDLSSTVNTDQSGRFTFPNLTPGDYKVFSWEAADTDAAYDPDFMSKYENQVPVVHVAEGSNQTINVRMIPTP